MKNMLREIIWGKNKFNGVFAVAVVGLILAGCCGIGDSGTTPTNTSTSSNTGDSPFGKDNPFSKNTSTTTTPAPADTNYTKADASKKQVPSDAEMNEIVKTTLLDFNDALQDADFTEFYGKISKAWQKQTSPDKLKQGFQAFIDGKTDISNISSMTPTYTSAPAVSKNLGYDMLMLKGEYATSPIKTTFELNYVPEGKDWKLALIRVYAAVKK